MNARARMLRTALLALTLGFAGGMNPLSAQPPSTFQVAQEDILGGLTVGTILSIATDGTVAAKTELRPTVGNQDQCATVAVWFLDRAGRDIDRHASPRFCASTRTHPWSFSILASALPRIEYVAVLQGADGDVYSIRERNLVAARRLAQVFPRFRTRGENLTAHWNVWMRDAGNEQADPTAIAIVGRRYTFVLDLAAVRYNQLSVASRVVADRLATALGEGDFDLTVKPVLLGHGLKFPKPVPTDEAALASFHVSVDKLRKEVPPRRDSQTFADYTWEVRAGRLVVSVEANAPGCAAVAFSIWDRKFEKPMDAVAHWVRVVPPSGATSASDSECRTESLAGRSLEDDLLPIWQRGGAQRADAALHVFEVMGPKKVYSAAVLAARIEGGAPRVLAWPLFDPPSTLLTESTFLDKLRIARSTGNYLAVGDHLRTALFTADNGDQSGPTEALKRLDELTRTVRSTIFGRLVTADGHNYYYPFGLMAIGKRLLGDEAVLVQPLPRQTAGGGTRCVSTWTSVIPIDLGDAALQHHLTSSTAAKAPGRISQRAGFDQYAHGHLVPPMPEGLLLLAHHGEGSLWFVKGETMRNYEITRPFAPGSIAVLAACRGGDPKADPGHDLLTHLNIGGIEAAIVSPFEVPMPLGVGFALHFGAELNRVLNASGGAGSDQPDLAEVFRRAGLNLLADTSNFKGAWPGTLHEWVLVGDGGIKICRSPAGQ